MKALAGNPATMNLRRFTTSIDAPVYNQEKFYGEVISATLDKLEEFGHTPRQNIPTVQEIVDNLALHPALMEGKGNIVDRTD